MRWSLDQVSRSWEVDHRSTDTRRDDSTALTTAWAKQLDPTSAVDRVAAREAIGRCGPDIDATLADTYPGLHTAATDTRATVSAGEASDLAQ